MAKAAGPACNLACRYCYYLEKEQLFEGKRHHMTDATLEEYIKSYIESQSMDSVSFVWHGGEALLRNIDFYRRAMALQRRYAGHRHIDNALQTNGTLLNDEWCRFLRDNNWLVGISIDGPAQYHDAYRRDHADKPTHNRVMRGIQMLRRYGVDWNAMAVVNDVNGIDPDGFYDFFRSIDCQYIQFTPIVELDAEGHVTPESVSPQVWGAFLCRLFDRWYDGGDVGKVFIQLFEAVLAGYLGLQPAVCSLAETCGHAGVIEHNGDIYCCDHFVYPEYYLGNIHTHSIAELMMSSKQQAFGDAKRDALPGRCRSCQYLRLCHGECPKNRFTATGSDADGATTYARTPTGINYLCDGYRMFFAHTETRFRHLANQLRPHL